MSNYCTLNITGGGGGGGVGIIPGPGLGDSPPGQAPDDQQGRTAQAQLPSLKQLWKGMQGAVPFVLLLLTKILYDHRLGKSQVF